MRDHQPAAWETSAPAPFLTITEPRVVEPWALARDRFIRYQIPGSNRARDRA